MGEGGREANAVDVKAEGGRVIELVRDLLDKQLVDRRGEPMGRVDGVLLAVERERQPRVVCLQSGIPLAFTRVGERVGEFAFAVARRWGVRHGRTVHVPWEKIRRIGIETELDVVAEETEALAWEGWLREHVVRYIPSLKRKKKQHESELHGVGEIEDFAHAPPACDETGGVALHLLIGRNVVDSGGKKAGRLEEVKARVEDGRCVVTKFLLGRGGMLERLSVPDVAMSLLSRLGAPHPAGATEVPWEEMDLADPKHPRLRCTREELRD
jgi:sporulation protein YlmC with PRC-barrel domain